MSAVEYRIVNMENRKSEYREHLLQLPLNDRRARFMHTLNNDGIEEYIEKVGSAQDKVFGAFTLGTEKEPVLVGASHLTFNNDVAEIAMSVDALYRHKGCGLALMNHGISYAKEHGYSQLNMVCLPQNRSMIRLADKAGFVTKSSDCDQHEAYRNV